MSLIRVLFWAAVILVFFASPMAIAGDPVPADPPLKWWKGNIHTHSLWSDGNDFPEMIAEWYRTHGYNFLALSDHNVLSEGTRWMKHREIVRRGGKDALAKYRARFGGGWVQTRGEPNSPDWEVRLKPLNEFRALVEQRGQFIMIQGEEISDRSQGKPVHLNATNIEQVIQPLGGATVREAIANNLRAVKEQAERVGRPILLHLNHPNFGYAVTAEDLAAVTEERFYEVYNGHPAVGHLGTKIFPSVERLWDIANTIRIAQLGAPPLWGVGVDDSHQYHGRPKNRPQSRTGRGWIMVRSRYLTPEHLIRAMRAGQFYASSGVTLEEVAVEENVLQLKIQPQEGVSYTTRFIGTPADYDTNTTPRTDDKGRPLKGVTQKYSQDVGRVFATVDGTTPTYRLTGGELYVRAVVTSTKAPPDPSFKDQREQAWTQPVGWKDRVK